MSRSDSDYLRYIRTSIERIERWIVPGHDEVISDEIRFEAILHRLETLADAASHLSESLKRRHPEIPWSVIIAFRNRLAHGYIDVSPERVWTVIAEDLQPLLDVVIEELDS